ncbi:hypothetical protein OH76DRAFT_1422766 [Lentinus brumalis]|uniref:Uncharacterized protein n=1 Tax=Lentinus brumalis TaxID=2498619 RepID=A0A371CP14_9APHY|nr:hypothetical protein OH76DRAFT_1422766 [Polyporus brumalis]
MPRVRAAKHTGAGSSSSSRPAPAPAPEPAADSMPVKRIIPKQAASSGPAIPPTPPRTTHKRKRRSRSRVTDSSSEDEDDHDVPQPESDREDRRPPDVPKLGEVTVGHKRRKTMTLDAIAEELSEARAEEQFWLGDKQPSSSIAVASSSKSKVVPNRITSRVTTRARSRTRSPSSSPPPAPHLLRRGHTGLFSPPPSRRAPAVVPCLATPPPTTHKAKEKEKKVKKPGLPERDSPNNPFLEDSSPAPVPAIDTSSEPRTPKKHVEKPTITMVFRGVKTEMLNPHYVHEEVAAEVEARARLPVHHPDYSPSDACVPKLLFPEARKHDVARRRAQSTVPVPSSPTPTTSRRTRAGSASSTEGAGPATKKSSAPGAPGPSMPTVREEEEVEVEVMSAVLAANIAKRMRKGVLADGDAPRTRPSSRSREVPELPEKDRSDPIKRALGPARRA